MKKSDPIILNIDKLEVLKRLGYKPKFSRLSKPLEAMIDTEIIKCYEILHPAFVKKNMVIKNKIPFESNSLTQHLHGCTKITLFACTIGSLIEEEVKNCFGKKESTRGLVIDAIGSIVVENLAENINAQVIKTAAQKGFETTKRFSPGYGDWNLSNQKKIFQLLQPEKIGIKLTESLIMLPEKSITAIIGWKERK